MDSRRQAIRKAIVWTYLAIFCMATVFCPPQIWYPMAYLFALYLIHEIFKE